MKQTTYTLTEMPNLRRLRCRYYFDDLSEGDVRLYPVKQILKIRQAAWQFGKKNNCKMIVRRYWHKNKWWTAVQRQVPKSDICNTSNASPA